MSNAPLQRVANYLCKLSSRHLAETMSDRELLELFVVRQEEAAFAAIVARHGALVRAVCRRVLRQDADADDAFQATFLILLRKAGSIGKRESLASWLHGVAHRVSLRAKAELNREHRLVRLKEAQSSYDGMQQILLRELEQNLDQAVRSLPECYRACFILCCMHGKSYAQAARLLGCTEGTVSSRVVRARERLRASLDRRGLNLSAGALGLELSRVAAPVPSDLFDFVLEIMRQHATGGALSGTTKSGLLAQGVIQSMFLAKAKIVAAVLLIALVGTGVSMRAYSGQHGQIDSTGAHSTTTRPDWSGDLVGIPSQRDGVIAFIGTEIKKGETVPESRQFSITIGNDVRKYRRLRLGDIIEKGQLIGQLDDRLARAELGIKQAKLASAEADNLSWEKTKEESYQRWLTQKNIFAASKKATSMEDVRGAELTYNRYVYELKSKEEAVKVAKLELEQARIMLEMYQIRSGVRGIVRRIHKHDGEAVKALETVVTLQIVKDDDQ